jgi:CDP-diacylglycerol---serine O-phosphatidyltransferase
MGSNGEGGSACFSRCHRSGQADRRGATLTAREQTPGRELPQKRPRRTAYALPTLFTSGNIFLGFVAIVQAFEGAMQAHGGDYGSNPHFSIAARALGFAVFFDGLDGRIARMTNTVSDFGRELDSLADVITFGIAPAVLAFVWGVFFVTSSEDPMLSSQLSRVGYMVAFFYLLCGAVRLARFNVQTNPTPKNPGKPDRKYFVGMPIPAGAGFIAAVVYFDTAPVRSFLFSAVWLGLVVMVSLLMVSSWRYPSFKQLGASKPLKTVSVLTMGVVAILIWAWSQPVLLIAAITYVSSGIAIRMGGVVRRLKKPRPSASLPEHQVG